MSSLHTLLQQSVDSIPFPTSEIVVIDSTEPIAQGFEKLLDNKILSAPVYNAATGQYSGFLDIRDLVSFCVFIYDSNVQQADNLLDIVNFGVKMFKHAVDGVTVTYLSKRNPFHAVKKGATLQEAVDILARGVRRVPVIDEQGRVVNIISQSSVVQLLHKHMGEFGAEFHSKISEIEIGSTPVLSVKKDTRAIDVFRLMDHHQRSGVAVVDESGVLVGNTSGRDLKLFIKTPSMSVLLMPIMQFLNQIRNLSIDITTPVISVGLEDTFSIVIGKLAATRVHRVFAVTGDYHPARVISITDVLRFIQAKVNKAETK